MAHHHRLSGFSAFALLSLLSIGLGGAGCGDSTSSQQAGSATGSAIQAIQISGQARFADGTPIAAKNVQYQLILDGANLFQAGVNGCRPTPAHVAGTVIENATTDASGGFALSIPIQSLYAAVVRQCTIQNLRSGQLEGATLRASLLADASSCPAYCSAQGNPSQSCVDDCQTGQRTLTASQALSADQLTSFIKSGVIQWQVGAPLSFSGIGPALTTSGGPDLRVDGGAARSSAHVDQESFDPSSCEVAEACVRAPGMRTVLRFDGTIQNLGSGDLVIGSCDSGGLFTMSSCHNVNLLKNIMLYELVDPASGEVVSVGGEQIVGRKQGFCMMDITQVNASAPQGNYTCDNQGITRGWADVYDSALECQFLDVTGVPAGNYDLRLTVDPDGLFGTGDSTDSTVEVPVSIPANAPAGGPNSNSSGGADSLRHARH